MSTSFYIKPLKVIDMIDYQHIKFVHQSILYSQWDEKAIEYSYLHKVRSLGIFILIKTPSVNIYLY